MLMESDPVARLLPGSEKLTLCIIIVDRFSECLVCELDEFRNASKVNLT